jgi:hypothetical protein
MEAIAEGDAIKEENRPSIYDIKKEREINMV